MKELRELLNRRPELRSYFAYKIGVSERTIARWANGDSKPNFAERKELLRIIKQKNQQEIPVLSGTGGAQKRKP